MLSPREVGNLASAKDTYENDDLKNLTQAWVNERCAPEILPYEDTLVTNLREMLEAQMANIEGIEPTDTDHWFRLVVFQQEIERIRFILRSYLRTRQEKIEKFALHLTRDELARSKLSPLEVDYSNRYFAIVETYLRNTASLESLLPRYQRLDEEGDVTMVTKPDLDEAVFCRVKEPLGDFQPENGGQAFEMNMGDIYIIRYSWIRKLLSEQKVQLL